MYYIKLRNLWYLRQLMVALAVATLAVASPWPLEAQQNGSKFSIHDSGPSNGLRDMQLKEFRSTPIAAAEPQKQSGTTPQGSPRGGLGEIGAKLANPLGDLWALSFSLNAPQFFDGDVNTGDPEVGGSLIFQPVLPIPVYGTGDDEWKIRRLTLLDERQLL